MLIFEAPAPAATYKGSMVDLKYRVEIGGVDWKKAYTTWSHAPGAAFLIPGTRTRTGVYQPSEYGHSFSFQYIKGVTYLQDDGRNNGKLQPWPHRYPAVEH